MHSAQPTNIVALVLTMALLAGCARAPPSIEPAALQDARAANATLTLPPSWHGVYSAAAVSQQCNDNGGANFGASTFTVAYETPDASGLSNATLVHMRVSWNVTVPGQVIYYSLGAKGGGRIVGHATSTPAQKDASASTLKPNEKYYIFVCAQAPIAILADDYAIDVTYT